jgi:hypothetical protein
MALVYFHCSNADEILLDRRGIDVYDLSEAHQRATQVVQDFIRTPGPDDWRAWTLHVTDDEGDELFLMPFSFVLGRSH